MFGNRPKLEVAIVPPNKALNRTCHSGLSCAGGLFSSQESPLWHAGWLGR